MKKNGFVLVLITMMLWSLPGVMQAQMGDSGKSAGSQNADVVLQINKPDCYVNFQVRGPKTIEVDFGDGEKIGINLEETQGVVEGNVIGRDFYLYSQDIVEIIANKNQLSKFEVLNGNKIKVVNVAFNSLLELSLKNMPNLESLLAIENKITAIDLESCPKLQYASVANNRDLENLNLSNNPELRELYVSNNSLSSLDLGNLPKLEKLSFDGNSEITSVDLSKLPLLTWLDCSGTGLSELNLESNPKLISLKTSDSYYLSELRYKNLNNLCCLHIFNCGFDNSGIDKILTDLPDVSSLEVLPEERGWKRQLEYENNPGAATANAEIAKNKGWFIDILKDSWSVCPKDPCLVFKTGYSGKLVFTIENLYDPFWILWAENRWGSYYHNSKYCMKHDVGSPTIRYCSRGLMTFECINMKLQELDFTGNDQTYAINVQDNEITKIVLDPANVMFRMNLKNNKLSGEAINNLFRSLNKLTDLKNPFYLNFEEVADFGVIDITGNPGCDACDVSIAEDKGYTVIGAGSSIESLTDRNPVIRVDESGDIVAGSDVYGVIVYDMDGKLVYKSDVSSNLYKVNLSDGFYLIGYKNSAHATYKYVKVVVL